MKGFFKILFLFNSVTLEAKKVGLYISCEVKLLSRVRLVVIP